MSRSDICLSIGNIDLQVLTIQLDSVQLAEIRIDLFKQPIAQLIPIFKSHQNLIITFRNEQNNHEEKIISIYTTAIDNGVKYIDIDANLPEPIKKELIQRAHNKNTKIILSYHDFTQTPEYNKLNEIVLTLKTQQADIVKIACMAKCYSDCANMMSLYTKHTNIIAFCIGEIGKITRIVAPIVGAPFTYAGIPGSETAQGQFSYGETERLLNQFKPLGNG